jgi:hypothetical protein
MTIRFGIVAGVSSDAQAHEDKKSIPDQIDFCRQKLKTLDAVETVEPYILDGYSRTDYDSLEVAMADIPPLGKAIQDAMTDAYDVLVLDNFDRLGDLGLMVGARFRKLRKQLYSVRQSGSLSDPENYDPYSSESNDIDLYIGGIVQRYRINKIRRGWNIGVPERARKGLHPLSTAYGYRTTGKDTPAEQIPEEVQLIEQMAAMYLQGKTLQEIVNHADSARKPKRAPGWTRTVVKRIILNPYYAGIVTFGKLKTVNKKRVRVPPSQWVTGDGQHVPIYDRETYNALLAEAERRDSSRSRAKVYTLSGVLSCSVCTERLHRHGKVNGRWPVDLSCPNGCINIRYDIALRLVAQSFVKALRDFRESPGSWDETERLESQIQAIEEKRAIVQEGYEGKVYTKTEASQRIHDLEIAKDKLLRQLERSAQEQEYRSRLLEFTQVHDLEEFGESILNDDPTEVNRLLTALCETIIITPRYEMRVVWR